jgi:hypothetical protein
MGLRFIWWIDGGLGFEKINCFISVLIVRELEYRGSICMSWCEQEHQKTNMHQSMTKKTNHMTSKKQSTYVWSAKGSPWVHRSCTTH